MARMSKVTEHDNDCVSDDSCQSGSPCAVLVQLTKYTWSRTHNSAITTQQQIQTKAQIS